MHDFCAGLNNAQKSALRHYTGPAMILAGPGSGKTTVLTKRVKHLLEKYGTEPSSILVITYTKAAAQSMQRRFLREMNQKAVPVVFGTFHAVYYHILKEHYSIKQDCFITQMEKQNMMRQIIRAQPGAPDYGEEGVSDEFVKELLGLISLRKNGVSFSASVFPKGITEKDFLCLEKNYRERTGALGKMDFDDMLICCLSLLENSPKVLATWQKRFSFILVDEFQDCSNVQYEVLKKLAAPQNNLFVVGDDDQSIYGFRGAGPGILRQFIRDYPAAAQVKLEANYRSRKEIVDASNCVIAQNRERFPKSMYAANEDRRFRDVQAVTIRGFAKGKEQYSYLTDRLLKLEERIPYEEMAVIFRTNAEMEEFSSFLKRTNIPYAAGDGRNSRYTHFAVKDIAAYLGVAAGKNSRSLFLQIANRPARCIKREYLTKETVDFKELKEKCLRHGEREAAIQTESLHRQLEQAGTLSPFLAIGLVRKVCGYERFLKEKAGKDILLYEEWKALLDGIQKEAKAFCTLREFLEFLKREEKNAALKRTDDYREGVRLMTLHASKGLEFSYVCIPNVNEGKLPYGRLPDKGAEEEERRLFYVGMTRAKAVLDILYLTGTKEYPRLPSRFLNPLF